MTITQQLGRPSSRLVEKRDGQYQAGKQVWCCLLEGREEKEERLRVWMGAGGERLFLRGAAATVRGAEAWGEREEECASKA
jgi:hypothetical protein